RPAPPAVCHCFPLLDSVNVYQDIKDPERRPIRIPTLDNDTAARTYSFTLEPGYHSIVQWQSVGGSCQMKYFIIDDRDTLRFDRDHKKFTKKPKLVLGGTWTYAIKE
ncbi:MAG: hypothetical protein JST39_06285, partial [Bacteroidetes bacterium]|nr:hypothetical protein [Bacteroidota bacterium]